LKHFFRDSTKSAFVLVLFSTFFFCYASVNTPEFIMSEESKTADGDYVMMGTGGAVPGKPGTALNLDDPSLSQEDRDHRLAIALQQQENAAAYNEHKVKHDAQVASDKLRTTRSGTYTKLAAVRAKDHGMLSVPSDYTSEFAYQKESDMMQPTTFVAPPPGAHPQEIADYKLAVEMQKVEQVDAGTVRTMQKMVVEEELADEAQALRTTRSKNTL
jgi:hypothetical protein